MRTGAQAIIFNADKTKVLLVKRRDIPVWVFPGGKIEVNEKPDAAAVRETKEESGYIVKAKRLVGCYTRKNGDLGYIYECNIIGGKAHTSNESSDVLFFDIKKLPSPVSPAVPVWLSDALKNSKEPINSAYPEVTTRMLLGHLLSNPNLVFRHLLVTMGIHWNG